MANFEMSLPGADLRGIKPDFRITVKNVSDTDTKIIASLHKITGQSLDLFDNPVD
jgi:hypothetical protein